MTPKISFATVTTIIGAALVFAVPAFGDAWGSDRNQETVRVSPHSVDRAAAVRQQKLSSMLDARERSLTAKSAATKSSAPAPIRDNRFRPATAATPIPATTVDSIRPIDWLQIAIGFAAGNLRDCPLRGDAGDPGPPTRPLINGHHGGGG